MIMTRSTIANTFAIAAVASLALGLAPSAKADDKSEVATCSDATIKGAFARTDQGFVIPPNSGPLPLAGLSLMTFDGNGRWTATGSASLNGNQFPPATSTGSYTVNADCTGYYQPDVAPPGRTGKAFFVIVDRGNGFQVLPLDQTASIICVARRVFPVGDFKD
jgi:hypothetical protein